MKKSHFRISHLLILILSLTFLFGITTEVRANENKRNAEIFEAAYFAESEYWSTYTGENTNFNPVYNQYIEEYEATPGFKTGYNAWATLNFVFDPDNIFQQITENDIVSEKGYYESLLFEILFCYNREETYLETTKSTADKICADMFADVFENYNDVFEYGKNKPLTSEEKSMLLNALWEDPTGAIQKLFTGIDKFAKVLDGFVTLEETINHISTYLAIDEISEQDQWILQEILDSHWCVVNEHMSDAVEDMLDLYKMKFNATFIITSELTNMVLEEAVEYIYKKIWEGACEILGGGFLKLTYSCGKAISNAWLSTDDYYESYIQMKCLADYEMAIENISADARMKYMNNQFNEILAAQYNAANCFKIKTYLVGYTCAIEYLKKLDDAGIMHVAEFMGNPLASNYDIIQQLKAEREQLKNTYSYAIDNIKEICMQGTEGHSVYRYEYKKLSDQKEIDDYFRILSDIQKTLGCVSAYAIQVDDLTLSNMQVKIGSLKVTGTLTLNNAQLYVDGDMTLCSIRQMTDPNDLIHVTGDLTVGAHYEGTFPYGSTMTAGRVELEGDLILSARDFRTYGYTEEVNDGFKLSENCILAFCGKGQQMIRGKLGSGWPQVVNVEIHCDDFQTALTGSKNPSLRLMNDAELTADPEDDSETERKLQFRTLDLNGHTLLSDGSAVTCELLTNSVSGAKLEAGKISGLSNIRISGDTEVTGDVKSDYLWLDEAAFSVDGNLTLCTISEMLSPEDVLHVTGDLCVGAYYGGTTYASTMTDGRVELEGNLIFKPQDSRTYGWTAYSKAESGYNPTKNCKTVFCGDGLQKITGNAGGYITIGSVEILCPDMAVSVSEKAPKFVLLNDVNLPGLTPDPSEDDSESSQEQAADAAMEISLAELDLNGHSFQTSRNLSVTGKLIASGDQKLALSAKRISCQSMEVQAEVETNGPVKLRNLYFDQGKLFVNDTLEAFSIARMNHEEDLLHVKGDLTVGVYNSYYMGNDYSGMTAGTVELEGNLIFKPNDSSREYQAYYGYEQSGTAKTVFCGNRTSSISGSPSYRIHVNAVNAKTEESMLSRSGGVYERNVTMIRDPEYRRGRRYLALAKILPGKKGYEYSDGVYRPCITVKYGALTLKEDEDYTLKTQADPEKGKADSVIKGVNPYFGSLEYTFDIEPVIDDSLKGHDYQPVSVVASACEHGGYTLYECAECGQNYKADYEVAGEHAYVEHVIEPTCITQGNSQFVCEDCGYAYVGNWIPPLGHQWDEGVIEEDADQAEENGADSDEQTGTDEAEPDLESGEGETDSNVENEEDELDSGSIFREKKYTCTVCGESYTETIPPAICEGNHTYVLEEVVAPSCTEYGYAVYSCEQCDHSYRGEFTAPTGHSIEHYEYDQNAALDLDGTRSAYCENGCGLKFTFGEEGSAWKDHVKVVGMGLSIIEDGNGEIGISYIVAVPKVMLESGAYIEAGLNYFASSIVEITEAEAVEYAMEDADELYEMAYFKVSGSVAAAQMMEKVAVRVVSENGAEIYSNAYSVMDYAEMLLGGEAGDYSEYKAIVKALLQFGAASQNYFGYKTETLADLILPSGERGTEPVTAEELAAYPMSEITGTVTGISYYGSSLNMKSGIRVRHYFMIDGEIPEELQISRNGKKLKLHQAGSLYYVETENIPISMYDQAYEISVISGEEQSSFTYSVFSYLYAAMENHAENDHLIELISAVYRLNE